MLVIPGMLVIAGAGVWGAPVALGAVVGARAAIKLVEVSSVVTLSDAVVSMALTTPISLANQVAWAMVTFLLAGNFLSS